MLDHPADFCYWLQNARYLNQSYIQPLKIVETNLVSAMFVEEISNEIADWTQWTSWAENASIERVLRYKGNH